MTQIKSLTFTTFACYSTDKKSCIIYFMKVYPELVELLEIVIFSQHNLILARYTSSSGICSY